MTKPSLSLAELLTKADDPDFLRRAAQAIGQMLMDADVEGLIGAARHERSGGSGDRITYRTATATVTSIPASARCQPTRLDRLIR